VFIMSESEAMQVFYCLLESLLKVGGHIHCNFYFTKNKYITHRIQDYDPNVLLETLLT
jgi:hypothetical protein